MLPTKCSQLFASGYRKQDRPDARYRHSHHTVKPPAAKPPAFRTLGLCPHRADAVFDSLLLWLRPFSNEAIGRKQRRMPPAASHGNWPSSTPATLCQYPPARRSSPMPRRLWLAISPARNANMGLRILPFHHAAKRLTTTTPLRVTPAGYQKMCPVNSPVLSNMTWMSEGAFRKGSCHAPSQIPPIKFHAALSARHL